MRLTWADQVDGEGDEMSFAVLLVLVAVGVAVFIAIGRDQSGGDG